VTDTSPRDLADRFQQRWLEHNPFAATMYGIPGYDHLLPDESEAGEQAWRAEVGRFGKEADAITAGTPALQRQRSLSVFSEGWGLYAEQLAEEAGLYDGDRALLGAISASLMRAARLVVDTGLHAFGWSRERALDYLAEHVPMPREVLAPEIDRYVVMPGQAVSYLTGKLEILRIRDEARQRLGPAFSLPAFHAAVLDHGSLPMPVLARSIADWLDRADGQSAG
jgi:uncharacterized protein (DUF885 family)